MRICRKKSSAFNPTKYSWFSLRPKSIVGKSVFWKTWAIENGFIDPQGNPSYGKIKTLIKYHCLGAKKHKNKWYVGAVSEEQINWKVEQWQEISNALFRRSQKIKGKKRHQN